jgi:hypothetical protein
MKLKTLLILLVITTVLAGVSTLVLRPSKTAAPQIGARLLPDLPVNDIARLSLATAEESVMLAKGSVAQTEDSAVWIVESRYKYAADFDKISEFVLKFSKLKIGRSFQGTPETLARLKLIDPAEKDADPIQSGTRVALFDADGELIAAYILGDARSTDSGSGGQYLRQAESDTVYLVDESFRFLKKTSTEWLEPDLLEIKESEVRQVSCYAAGTDTPLFQVGRPEKGKPAALLEVPKDRTVDNTKVEQLLGALAPLKIKDLAGERREPAPAMGEDLHLTYALFNGQRVHIYPRQVGEGESARFELEAFIEYEAPPAVVEKDGESAEESTAATDTSPETQPSQASGEAKGAEDETKPPSPEEMQALTSDLAAKLRGWTFVLEKWQWQSFITQVEGLLEPEKPEEAAAGTDT